jgi:tight adherence protein B
VVGLLLGQGIGARPLGVLLGTSLGHVALVIAVGLELAGLSWMAALLRRAEPP